MKKSKILIVAIVLLALISTSLSAQEVKKSAMPAYLLSIFVGFGTGHFYIGSDKAIIFLLLDAAAIAVEIGGGVYMMTAALDADVSRTLTGSYIMYGGLAAVLIVKVVEIINIMGEVDKKRAEGVVAKIEPRIAVQPESVAVSLSYKY